MAERIDIGKPFGVARRRALDPMGGTADFYTLRKGTSLTGVTLGINGTLRPMDDGTTLQRDLEARVVEPVDLLPGVPSRIITLAPDSEERRGYASALAVDNGTLERMAELEIKNTENEDEIRERMLACEAELAKIDRTLAMGSTYGMFPLLKPILPDVTSLHLAVLNHKLRI